MSIPSLPLTMVMLAQSSGASGPENWAPFIFRDDVMIPVLLAGSIISIVAIRTIAGIVTSVSRERSRREIAAFIAEGSMTAEQGERLMRAGNEKSV